MPALLCPLQAFFRARSFARRRSTGPGPTTAQAAHSEGPQESVSDEKEACPRGRDSEAKIPFKRPSAGGCRTMHALQGLRTKRHSDGRGRLMSAGDGWALQPVMRPLRSFTGLREACMPAHDK